MMISKSQKKKIYKEDVSSYKNDYKDNLIKFNKDIV